MTTVEQIKDRLNIVDIVGGYLKLDKAGINYKAKCPFHNEKTPSFMVSPSRQSFYCFGCGEKGDIFSFVEKFEGLDFKEALKMLAEKAGVELPKFRKQDSEEEKDTREIIYKVTEDACDLFEQNLKATPEATDYLRKRGLSIEMIKKWRLGYAKPEWRDLFDKLSTKGYKKEQLLEAGLIKEKMGKYYDTFRQRITFPIFDPAGRVVAFSGRIFPDSDNGPKYLNSPETPIFHKSNVLYGWHLAKSAIRKLDYAVLVEGQMDLLLSHQAGVANTVASSGTALTTNHLQMIQKLSNRIIIAYDSDKAGEKAGQRAAELALSLGIEVKLASLPEGEDPASIASKDPTMWREYLRKSLHLIEFVLKNSSKTKKGSAMMKEVEKNVLPYFAFISNEMERSHFIKKIAELLEVNEDAVIKEISRLKNPSKVATGPGFGKDEDIDSSLEKIIAGIIFSKPDQKFKKRLQKIISEEEIKKILKRYEPKKEALIFEAEEFIGSEDEIFKRFELVVLQEKVRIKTKSLDHADEKNLEKLKTDLNKIAKRISELLKN